MTLFSIQLTNFSVEAPQPSGFADFPRPSMLWSQSSCSYCLKREISYAHYIFYNYFFILAKLKAVLYNIQPQSYYLTTDIHCCERQRCLCLIQIAFHHCIWRMKHTSCGHLFKIFFLDLFNLLPPEFQTPWQASTQPTSTLNGTQRV